MVPSEDQNDRLANVLAWIRTAKENLPAVSNRTVAAATIAEASALLDRMQRVAVALRDRMATVAVTAGERRAA